MKVSKKSIYACLAVLELARNYQKEPLKIAELSKRRDIPLGYLEQILHHLKGAGLLRSRRGADGGYLLVRPPGEITVGQIVELTEGTLRAEDFGSSAKAAVIRNTLFEAHSAASILLKAKTFAVLAEEESFAGKAD